MSFKYGVHTGIETWETEISLEKLTTIHFFNSNLKQIYLTLHYSLECTNKLLQIILHQIVLYTWILVLQYPWI